MADCNFLRSFRVPGEGEMEAQNELGVCHVKNEGLSQHSDMATKGTSRLERHFR